MKLKTSILLHSSFYDSHPIPISKFPFGKNLPQLFSFDVRDTTEKVPNIHDRTKSQFLGSGNNELHAVIAMYLTINLENEGNPHW